VLSQVKSTVDAALANAAAVGNQPVGSITADITTALPNPALPPAAGGTGNRDDRANESTLGDLVGNALRDGLPADMGKADLGVVNPGGLRAELLFAGNTATNPANSDGVVTYSEANDVLPFVNNIWTVDLTGASLKKVLEQQWQPAGSSRPFLALGLSDNVRVTYDPSAPAGSHVTSVLIDDKPLDPTATYTVSTFSFLGTGGDNFTAFTEGKARDTGLVDRDLWISYLKSHPGLSPDFARQQVGATGLPAAVQAKRHYEFTLSKLDLTSAGSPANTGVTITADRGHGSLVKVGSARVMGGTAQVSIDVPAQVKSGVLTLVAQPSGTTVTIPVEK
jgi:5'-nucleotidase